MVKNTAIRNGLPPRKHHPSFSGFFSRILPSNRPEQGGTARAHDITGETDSAYIDLGMNPNDLTEWNLARECTLGTQPSEASTGYQHHRGQSLNIQRPPTPLHRNRSQSPEVPQRTSSLDLARLPHLKPPPQERYEKSRPITTAEIRRMLKAKEESRRNRRDLKESGDWLGVQGADPYSGEFAVLTPTSTMSSEVTPPSTQERLAVLSQRQEDAKLAYDQARLDAEEERERMLLRKGQSKIKKMERAKEKLRQKQRHLPTWSQHKRRWSSAAEPELSPIPQSVKSDKAEDGSDEAANVDGYKTSYLSKLNGESVTDEPKPDELVDNSENIEPAEPDTSKDRSTDTIVRKALAKVAKPSTSVPYSSVLSKVDNLPPQEPNIEKHFLWRRRWRRTDPGGLEKHPTLEIVQSPAEKTEQHLVSRFTQPPPPVAFIRPLRESRKNFSDPLIPDSHLHLVSRAERVARMQGLENRTTQDLSPAAATKPTTSSHSEARGNPALWIATDLSGCQELRDNPQLATTDIEGATAISSRSKLKGSRKLLLGGRKIIPFRSSSYQVELVPARASQVQIQNSSQTYHHISTDVSRENLGTRTILQQSTIQAGSTMKVPDECIDINIKAHQERDPAQSASIPIITITGLDHDLQFPLGRIQSRMGYQKGEEGSVTDRDESPPIHSLQSSKQALCGGSMAMWEQGTRATSRPTTPPSGSQSSEPLRKIHGTDTTSTGHAKLAANPSLATVHIQRGGPCLAPHQRPQNKPLRLTSGKLEGLGTAISPPRHHKATPGHTTEVKGRENNDASPSHHREVNKAHGADQCQVPTDHKETLIQEAARIAMQRSRAREIVTTRGHMPSPRSQDIQKVTNTIQPLPGPKGSNSSCGGGDTDSSVIKTSSADGQPSSSSRSQLLTQQHKILAHEDGGENTKTSIAVALAHSLLTVCMIWLGLARALWVIARPAFDQRSQLWRRRRRRQSTREDACVFAAAGAFFVVGTLLLAVGVRAGVWAAVRI
ncbi:hypothetical protein F5Y14DRAFT_458307 [Nemania sp. NC0429]|nr:hypothetical protein F5Y14DRAFT_458307 [Nemania sp. NC0429]